MHYIYLENIRNSRKGKENNNEGNELEGKNVDDVKEM